MTFDPDVFMSADNKGELDTEFVNVPEGEYNAVATDLKVRTTQTGKVILDVSWEINDPEVEKATGRETNTVRQSVFLDMDDSGERISAARGKNISLGRLLEAVGINMAKPWSLASIKGNVGLVTVKHRMVEDGTVYADVKRVAAA